MLLLDTCTLIWWTLFPEELSKRAKTLLEQRDILVAVCSISIWEFGIKVKKRQLAYHQSVGHYVEHLQQIENFKIIPMDEKIWIKTLELNWKHKDPADRSIVATALIHQVPLITPDRAIKAFYSKTIW
ncbi:MAG: type II toxin-antitoxin system VapC family toxin [Deltaproteobacteria bacterium]|nr:type II toxin-antitoxin system VapC family toxin [Deltaproteobacteria bacterium]